MHNYMCIYCLFVKFLLLQFQSKSRPCILKGILLRNNFLNFDTLFFSLYYELTRGDKGHTFLEFMGYSPLQRSIKWKRSLQKPLVKA